MLVAWCLSRCRFLLSCRLLVLGSVQVPYKYRRMETSGPTYAPEKPLKFDTRLNNCSFSLRRRKRRCLPGLDEIQNSFLFLANTSCNSTKLTVQVHQVHQVVSSLVVVSLVHVQ